MGMNGMGMGMMANRWRGLGINSDVDEGSNNGNGNGNGNEEVRRNRERREFLCGMFLGSIAGIWILIFLILAQRGGYSRRFRLGVTLGVALNLMVQLTYQYPQAPSGDGSDGDDASASAS